MHNQLAKELEPLLSFTSIDHIELVQSLWSGYGVLLKVHLSGADWPSVIVKRIQPPAAAQHLRQWNTDLGHQRKLRSYEVELHWYQNYAHRTHAACRIPQCLGTATIAGGHLLVLEDLDAAGFPLRKTQLTNQEIEHCMAWLAHFHAEFLQDPAEGLWESGTYWQLDTRPEEWKAMPAGSLKTAAKGLHQALEECTYKTLVHGDAKYANFCFSTGDAVAAVDFQYVGAGCGMKDLAYLLSCKEGGLRSVAEEKEFMDIYFYHLHQALGSRHPNVDGTALETEWRLLYSIAWADFERFLQGWAPGHWKRTAYSQRQVDLALRQLG